MQYWLVVSVFFTVNIFEFFYSANVVAASSSFRGRPSSSNDAAEIKPVICLTPGCALLAAQLLNSMNTTVDPCDDFFEYSCGKYVASHTMADDEVEYGLFQDLEEQIAIKLKRELESAATANQSATVKKAKNVYGACMNTTEIGRRGVQPLLDLLRTTTPWPAVDDNNNSAFDLVQALANLARLGSSALVGVRVTVDSKNASKHILSIDQAALGMPSRDYLLRNGTSDPGVRAYYAYMSSVVEILKHETEDSGNTNNEADSSPKEFLEVLFLSEKDRQSSELLDVVEFEIELANITTAGDERRDPSRLYNNMTVKQLSERVPELDWLRLLNVYLKGSGVEVDENEVVVVFEPQYLAKLTKLLQKTPERVLANYLGWRTVEPFIVDVDDGEASLLQAARVRYTKAISGRAVDPPRWKFCVEAAKSVVMGVGRLYVEKYFNPADKPLVDDIIISIQHAFEQEVPQLKWLGDRERQQTLEKGRAMLRLIAYDDRLLNDTWLDEQYSVYVGNAGEHFENVVGNARASDAMMQLRLRKPADRKQWDMPPMEMNANYDPRSNTITFLAGDLQLPFFGSDQPMSVNYGGIGIVAGHEIIHNFDDNGRHFDKDGSLSDWWGNQTVESFQRETQCVVDFYSNYTVRGTDGLHINGKFTLGENLADLGGTRLSYRAYENWKAKNKKQADVRLPGLLNYTSDQLFFLSGGLMWCNYVRPESRTQYIFTDPHSPPNFRVLGEYSNFPEFSRAFNCPVGSKMNPTRKCKVW